MDLKLFLFYVNIIPSASKAEQLKLKGGKNYGRGNYRTQQTLF